MSGPAKIQCQCASRELCPPAFVSALPPPKLERCLQLQLNLHPLLFSVFPTHSVIHVWSPLSNAADCDTHESPNFGSKTSWKEERKKTCLKEQDASSFALCTICSFERLWSLREESCLVFAILEESIQHIMSNWTVS